MIFCDSELLSTGRVDRSEGFSPDSFDRVLDAPCSALGLRPRLFAGEETVESLGSHAKYQRRMFDQAVQLVRPGGVIVYSTVEDLCIQGLETCYLLDFIPPKEFLLDLSRKSKCKVIGFDHRKSVLRHIPSANDCPENIVINVNHEKSSSSSVYEYFAGKLEEVNISSGAAPCLVDSKDKGRVELILKYIEDADLRRWSLPGIKAFNLGLSEWRSRFNCISNP